MSTFDPHCMACQVVAGTLIPPGGIIYEGEHWLVSHQISPALLRGFLIVKTRRHCEHIAELTDAEAAEFGPIVRNVTRALSDVVSPAKVYVCSFGEAVTHIHFYVIPRYPDLPANGLKTLDEVLRQRQHRCSDDEAAQIAAQVRARLARPT